MNVLFQNILQLSAAGSIVILAVLLARLPMKPCAPSWRYALWMLVLIQLLIPMRFSSPVSVYNALPETVPLVGDIGDIVEVIRPEVPAQSPAPTPDRTAQASVSQLPASAAPVQAYAEQPSSAPPINIWSILATVWAAGTAVLLLLMAIIYAYTYHLVKKTKKRSRVVTTGVVSTPFVIGLARPLIVLPRGLDEECLPFVLEHERAHIRRFDHITRLVAMFALCVHWFNPLVWFAVYIMTIDCEAACDASATRAMDEEQTKQYARALVHVASGGKKRLISPMLAFSKQNLKGRIKQVLSRRRHTLLGSMAAILVLVCVACVTMTGPLAPEIESIASPSTTLAGTANTTPAPAITSAPTPETILPLAGEPFFVWEGESLEMPALTAWEYASSDEKVFDIEQVLDRLWKGKEYTVTETGEVEKMYRLENSPHGNYREDIGYDGDNYLNYRWNPYKNMPKYSVSDIAYDQAMQEATIFFADILGSDEFTLHPRAEVPVYDEDGKLMNPPNFHELLWDEKIDGVPLDWFVLRATRINEGIVEFSFNWNALAPLSTQAPENPITFDQAVYALNYFMEQSKVPEIGDFSLLANARLVYSYRFNREAEIWAPAWEFTLERSEKRGWGTIVYVDACTGEVYGGPWDERVFSPFTAHGFTRDGQKEYEQNVAREQTLNSLFPLEFGRKDGYIYSIRPRKATDDVELWQCAQIWRRNEATGAEEMISSMAHYELYDNEVNIHELRKSMFAAIIGDQIVFRGYMEMQDMKGGGIFVAMNLDGSDPHGLPIRRARFTNPCADGDRLYYLGYPDNDGSINFPINYIDITSNKDIHRLTTEKMFFGVKDGVIYAIDSTAKAPGYYSDKPRNAPSGAIYKLVNNEWVVERNLSFDITDTVYLLEQDAWLMLGDGGEEVLFDPAQEATE